MTALLISSYIVPYLRRCIAAAFIVHTGNVVPIMNGRRRGTREESLK